MPTEEETILYQKQIEAWAEAHRDAMIEDIKTLVRIRSDKDPSLPGKPYGEGPADVLQKALSLAEGYGFYVTNYDNYVGTVDFKAENDHHLDILSHLDVVPVADGWTVTEPFDPIVQDGRIYGRGTADDKGPSIAALYALRCVKELGVPLKHNVRLIWGCDEECGSSDIAYYFQKEPEAVYTFSPDADFPVINIEKGGLAGTITAEYEKTDVLPRIRSLDAGLKINVVPDRCTLTIEGMRKGVAEIYCAAAKDRTSVRFQVNQIDSGLIEINAFGVGAHAADPGMGNNAITATLELISLMHLPPCPQVEKLRALSSLLPHGDFLGKGLGVCMSDEISGELTLSLNIIHAGDSSLTAQFDSRCPICASEENMKQVVARQCETAGLRLEDTPMRPPHHVPADSPFIQTLLDAYIKYTGDTDAKPLAIGGGTYCHEIENGVAFGCTMPGTDNRMHGNDEFAVVDELLASVKIFAEAIIGLCG